jgi:hypothetical protein
MTGVTSGAGTAYPSGAPEFTPGFMWDSCYSIFSFMCMCCWSCLSFCTFSFGHCVVFFLDIRILISSLVSFGPCVVFFLDIRILITSLWYLQTLLTLTTLTSICRCITWNNIQSNLYWEVTFGTKKNWAYKTGDLLKEVQFI